MQTDPKFRPRKRREGRGCFGMVRQHLYRWATSRRRTFAAAEERVLPRLGSSVVGAVGCWLSAVGSWQLDVVELDVVELNVVEYVSI